MRVRGDGQRRLYAVDRRPAGRGGRSGSGRGAPSGRSGWTRWRRRCAGRAGRESHERARMPAGRATSGRYGGTGMTGFGAFRRDWRAAIRFERRYEASPEELWPAWTRAGPDRPVARRRGGGRHDRARSAVPARLGRRSRPAGRPAWSGRCEPPELLEWEWTIAGEPPTVLRVELSPGGRDRRWCWTTGGCRWSSPPVSAPAGTGSSTRWRLVGTASGLGRPVRRAAAGVPGAGRRAGLSRSRSAGLPSPHARSRADAGHPLAVHAVRQPDPLRRAALDAGAGVRARVAGRRAGGGGAGGASPRPSST